MKAAIILSVLLLAALIAGCGEDPSEESRNIAAILSPDGSRIAFARTFRYYFNKASVFDPGGWEETVYNQTSIYIIDRSAGELTKLSESDEDWYYCDRYYCPVNVSWENDVIAYSFQYTIHITDPDGAHKASLDISTGKFGPPIPFTLSGDREGLYSIGLDGTGKSFIADLKMAGFYEIHDMMWDSGQDRILLIERTYDNVDPVVWQIDPNGKGLGRSEQGLMEYRRRRLGGWESDPPFAELEGLTRDITHAEWGVPEPDEFD
jgi:hypothetical protein